MNRIICILAVFILLIPSTGRSTTREEAESIIANSEKLLEKVDANKDIAPYVPYDIYSEALINIIYAKNLLDEKKYVYSYYYAAAATIRFQTATMIAEARRSRHKKLELDSENCGMGMVSELIIDANLLKKGPVFRTILFDRQLFPFKKGKVEYKLNADGKNALNRIVLVLKKFPQSRVKIVGHTESFDYKEYSRQKAKLIADYLAENEIDSSRIEAIGMGNREVTLTYVGYRRVSRIEIIISGIE